MQSLISHSGSSNSTSSSACSNPPRTSAADSSLKIWLVDSPNGHESSPRPEKRKSAVHATVSTKEKARYIQFVRAGQRLPAPNHITQRKPLASILLQASDWTFLYDLEGQLQFPIEAAVTSLRPDVVLFSRSSKTIVLLELTVPLEDNVHQAHDRKTTKYSALVTACEENGFKTHMFALEVGCLGYCPHSFLHCFKALGLPKSAARQIRSEASKTALRSSYVLFLRRGMPTWECQAVLY